MGYVADLTSTRNQIAANLKTMTASPQPSYSIEGQSFSWQELFSAYTAQLKEINALIASGELGADDTYEIEEFGF